ncbi:MAG: YybS family protein [Clostridiales bacterium]|nr:YybS family protein [Clostridiales bacterium]
MQKTEILQVENKLKPPSTGLALGAGLIGALFAGAPLGLLFLPGVFAYLLTCHGTLRFSISLVLYAAGAVFYWSMGAKLLPLLFYFAAIPLAAAIFVAGRRKAAYFDIAMLCAALLAFCFYGALNIYNLTSGQSAFHDLQSLFYGYMPAFMETFELMYATLEIDMPEVERLLNRAIKEIPTVMPAIICALAAVGGLVNIVVFQKMCKNRAAHVKPMRPLSHWQLPKSFVTGTLVLAAGIVAVNALHLTAAPAINGAIGMVIAIPFMVQGLALFFFTRRRRGKRGTLLLALSLLMVFLLPTGLPMAALALILFGVAEQVFHMRRRIIETDARK